MAIKDAVVASLCDDFVDPLQTFDSCHMLILEYTRQRLCGKTTGICAHILFREQRYSGYLSGDMYGIEKNGDQSIEEFTK